MVEVEAQSFPGHQFAEDGGLRTGIEHHARRGRGGRALHAHRRGEKKSEPVNPLPMLEGAAGTLRMGKAEKSGKKAT